MVSPRRVSMLAALAAALLLGLTIIGGRDAPSRAGAIRVGEAATPAGAHATSAAAWQAGDGQARPAKAPVPGVAQAETGEAGEALAAVAVARRVCALVDRGSLAAARWHFARRDAWPSGLWRRLQRVRFRSARLVALRAAPYWQARVRVRALVGPRPAKLIVLSFTLGRVGGSPEWLVTAVRRRPQRP
jgi:hypothetical protein